MFKVLTHRRKSRLTSPRFVMGSIGAHIFVALVVVTVSRAAPIEPQQPDNDTLVFRLDDDPPAKTDDRPPPAATPAPARPVAPNQADDIVPPTDIPPTIEPELPGTQPVIADPGIGGRPGPSGPALPAQPADSGSDYRQNFNNGVIPGDYADTKPTLANGGEAGRLLQRFYPTIFADAGVEGHTVVEIVIDANGRVRPGTARVVESTHPEFGEAALRMVERFRFRPAKVGEQAVAVSVQIPIQWRVPQ